MQDIATLFRFLNTLFAEQFTIYGFTLSFRALFITSVLTIILITAVVRLMR